jgi:GrpB-like predicted nucleotidyltransferase (UPF0157 family)
MITPMPTVELVDYRDSWPSAFRTAAAELAVALAGHEAVIEHIGSTAVPGLCAKPVIDVLVGIARLADVAARAPQLAELGYCYRPEYEVQIPDRRYFVRDASAATPRVHVHAVQRGGALWRDHLAFRDALRTDPRLATDYAILKQTLAATVGKEDYADAKGPFVRAVVSRTVG